MLNGARALLLCGPAVLAFFTGGYFDGPRAWAGLIAWALVAVAAALGERPLLSGWPARLAAGGLALLAAWTLASIAWAPIAGSAYHAGQIVVVYVGVLLAAAMLLRQPRAQRAVEPVLAAGALIVIGYGLSERLLPGLLHFQRSLSAEGRLEQPLTYWNAMGEVAAIGLVLCARLIGEESRPRLLRVVALSASVPLGMGLYSTFSRGALFAWLAGLVALVVLAPRRAQVEGVIFGVAAAAAGALIAAPLHSVSSLAGSQATRERQGAIALGLMGLAMIVAALLLRLRLPRQRHAELPILRRAGWPAVALICAGLAVAIIAGAKERSKAPLSPGASRLVTLQSNRYAYWRVALRAFGDEPLRGVGAGGWAVYWLRYRPFREFAQDAHSLPLQTMAELGLVGLALLAAFLAGIGFGARDALRASPLLAAGPIAGFVAYLAHAPLDWDWQMPAVTAIAIVLAGAVLAQLPVTAPPRSAAPRG